MTRTPRTHLAWRSRLLRGFSLLELVLVLALLAMAAALTAPALTRFARHREALDAAAELLAVMHYARSQAMHEGVPHRLYVDVRHAQYRLTVQRQGAFVPLASSLGQTRELPANMALAWESSVAAAENGYIDFHPDGSHDAAVLAIIGHDGSVTRLAGDLPAEPFRVVNLSAAEVRR